MNEPKKRGAAPGENRGKGNQGRKPSRREMVKVTVRIFKDQQPVTNEQIREALDIYFSKNLLPDG